jgi:hypothetical protein
MSLKQLLCVHWFDPPVTLELSEFYGAIVNCEQKQDIVTREYRTCSKCGYEDSRIIKREYEGWV